MFRILIVDDEPYIVDWICGLVESIDSYELDIYRAYSASEAVNLLDRARVDLMVSDICMPGLSGIDLLKKVKSNWQECKVIMLTGYDDFDYAYESIQNKAYQYMLKTEEDSEILKVILRALEESENELEEAKRVIDSKKQAKDAMRLAQQSFLQNLIEGVHYQDVSNMFSQYGIALRPDIPYFALVGTIHHHNPHGSGAIIERNNMNAQSVVESHLSSKYDSVAVQQDASKIIWLLQPKPEEVPLPTPGIHSARITGFMEKVQSFCQSKYRFELSFVYSSIGVGINKLPDMVRMLEQALSTKSRHETGFIINYNTEADEVPSEATLFDGNLLEISQNEQLFEQLYFYLQSGQKENYYRVLDQVGSALRNTPSRHDSHAVELYYKVALMILAYINKNKLNIEVAFEIGLFRLMHIDGNTKWHDQVAYLQELSEILFDKQKMDYGRNDLVLFLKQYISDHIGQDVSLVKLGEVTRYNPSYLSRTFKESTGSTLTSYINSVRLKSVKEMMQKETLSLNDIAMKAGFNSRQYFNRFVKKMVNLTPDELRRSILSSYRK